MRDLIEQAKDIYEKLGEEIERLEGKPSGSWKPKERENYFLLQETGRVTSVRWYSDDSDIKWYYQGHVFPTREAAERERDRRILIQELKEFADFVPDWGEDSWKYEIFYSFYETKWDVSCTVKSYKPQTVYFETAQRAQEAIEHFGDRLDLLLPEGAK